MTVHQSIAKGGDKNPMAKLTLQKVKAIRAYAKKDNLQRGWKTKLAKKYNVQSSTIANIISGKSWKAVDEEQTLFGDLGQDERSD